MGCTTSVATEDNEKPNVAPMPAAASAASSQVDASHFNKIRQIGMGGFAEVFVAQRINGMRELVAMKRVDKLRVLRFKEETTTSPRGEVKVQTKVRMSSTVWVERNVWALIDSPFLVPLLHCFQDEKYLYFVMPLFGPSDLNMLLRHSGCMPEQALRFYAAEVVLALEALHSASIVYRDLKPHNILMRPDGHICLSDFGLCKQVPPGGDGISEIRGHVGTKGFQAPEIIRNTGHSFPVDFFALGVTLFRLATDSRPFNKNKASFTHQIPILSVHRVLRPPEDPALARAAYSAAELAQQYVAHALALGLLPAQAAQAAQQLAALHVRTGGGGYLESVAPAALALVGSPNHYTASVGGAAAVRRSTVNGAAAAAAAAASSTRGNGSGSPVSLAPSAGSSSSGASNLSIAQSIQMAIAAGVGTPQPGEYVVGLSPELVDLIQQLMDIDPQYRLGTRNRLVRPAHHYSASGGGAGPGTPRARRAAEVSQTSPRLGAVTSPDDPSNAEACSVTAGASRRTRRVGANGEESGGEAEDSGGSESKETVANGPRKSVLAMRQGQAPVAPGGSSVAAGSSATGAADKKPRHSPRTRGGRTPTQTQSGTSNSGVRSPRMMTYRGRDDQGQWNSLHNGFAQIKAHPFFAGLDWDALAEGRLRPPFVPQTNVSAIAQTFKQQLPEKARKDGVVPKRLTRQEQALFRGFELNTAFLPQQASQAQQAADEAVRGLSAAIAAAADSGAAPVAGGGKGSATPTGRPAAGGKRGSSASQVNIILK